LYQIGHILHQDWANIVLAELERSHPAQGIAASQVVARMQATGESKMAFIRKRISPSRRQTPSYQVIETYREDGKVKQRVLANLGRNPTPEKALSEFREEMLKTRRLIDGLNGAGSTERRRLDRWRRLFDRRRAAVQKLEALISSGKDFGPSNGSKLPSQESPVSFLDWVIERNSSSWL
jgi:hypothetical protein